VPSSCRRTTAQSATSAISTNDAVQARHCQSKLPHSIQLHTCVGGSGNRPAQALAATGIAMLDEHSRRRPPGFYELAEEARQRLDDAEWQAIIVLMGRPSGWEKLQQYWAQPGMCVGCLYPRPGLGKCQRGTCAQLQCARQLCQGCRTESDTCPSNNCCSDKCSPWRAAIRVLQKYDHVIAQRWLEAAVVANFCHNFHRRGPETRLDRKHAATFAKSNQPNTTAN
jgi:hypothetical protein